MPQIMIAHGRKSGHYQERLKPAADVESRERPGRLIGEHEIAPLFPLPPATEEPPNSEQTRQRRCVHPPGAALGVAVGEGVTSITGYGGLKSESETSPTSVV